MKHPPSRPPLHLWWRFITLAGASAFLLGLLGFDAYFAEHAVRPQPSAWDVLYRTLQMFFLNWEHLPAPLPWPLQAGRFLAAFVAVSAVIGALLELSRGRLQRLRLRSYRGHVVVCGLGQGGAELVGDLLDQGWRVVVIEGQATHPDLAWCRERGAIVLNAPPSDPRVLGQAGVDRAAMLLSLFQDDAASIEALMHAHQLSAGRPPRSLRCVVQVFDHEIQALLRKHDTFRGPQAPVALDLFNLFDLSAQVMLQECPALSTKAQPRRLLVVGMGWLGQSLLVRAARSWRIEQLAGPPGGEGPREVIAVDRDGDRLEAARLRAACPFLEAVCTLTPRPCDVESEAFLAGKFLPQQDRGNTVDAAFVCLPDDRLALLTAFRLRERFGPRVPLVVCMTSRHGLAKLLAAKAGENIHVVGLLDLAATIDLVTTATVEMLAREVHGDYVRDQLARDPHAEQNPAVVPWHRLDEALRASNRGAAAHVAEKLRVLGCEAVPVREIKALRRLTEPEVDALAKLEHERWCEERRRAGWRLGPAKDLARKISPHLRPYEDLDEAVKETNRAAVRRIPVWLAKAGFDIQRLLP